MQTNGASRFITVLACALSLLGVGCLPGYAPPQTGAPQNVGDPNNPDAGGAADQGPGPLPTPTADLGATTNVDLGGATNRDLGGQSSPDLASARDLGPGTDAAIACDPLQSTAGLVSPSGHHNAGQECQGCHAPGNGAPTFYLGGTLYDALSGGAGVAGATINVTDAAGRKLKIISANDGNFWTSTQLTFPVTVNASLCPSTVPMVAAVGGNGACNNCHGGAFRVHLP